jgi:hypothetical protein
MKQIKSIEALKNEGFKITHSFSTTELDIKEKFYILSKKIRKFTNVIVEVDPFGLCNGEELEDYLYKYKNI